MEASAADEASVAAAARMVGIELTAAQVSGVTQYFRLLGAFAAQLEAFDLDQSGDAAAVFTPCSPPTPAP